MDLPDSSSSSEDNSVTENIFEHDEDALLNSLHDDTLSSLFGCLSSDSDADNGPESIFNVTKPYHVPGKNKELAQKGKDSNHNDTDHEMVVNENMFSSQKLVGNMSENTKLQEHVAVSNGDEDCYATQSVVDIHTEVEENAMLILTEATEILSETFCLTVGSVQVEEDTETLSQTACACIFDKQNEQSQLPPITDVKETNNIQRDDAHDNDVTSKQWPQVTAQADVKPLDEESTVKTEDFNTSFIMIEHNEASVPNASVGLRSVPKRLKSDHLNKGELPDIKENTEHCDMQSVQLSVTKDLSDAATENEPCYKETGQLEEKIGEGIGKDVSLHGDIVFENTFLGESFIVIDDPCVSKNSNIVAHVCSEVNEMSKALQGVCNEVANDLQNVSTNNGIMNNEINNCCQKDTNVSQENDQQEPITSYLHDFEDEQYDSCVEYIECSDDEVNEVAKKIPEKVIQVFENETEKMQDTKNFYQISDGSVLGIGTDLVVQKGYQSISSDVSETELHSSVRLVSGSDSQNEAEDTNHVQSVKNQISMFENMIAAKQDPSEINKLKSSHMMEAVSFAVPSTSENDLNLNYENEMIYEIKIEHKICKAKAAEEVLKCPDDFTEHSTSISCSDSKLDHSFEHHEDVNNVGSNDSQVNICDTTNIPELDSSQPPPASPKSHYVIQQLEYIKAAQDIKQEESTTNIDNCETIPGLYGYPKRTPGHSGYEERVSGHIGYEEGIPEHSGYEERTPEFSGYEERIPDHYGSEEKTPGYSGYEERTPGHSSYKDATQTYTEEQTQSQESLMPEKFDMASYDQFYLYPGQQYQYPYQPQVYVYVDENGQYQYVNPFFPGLMYPPQASMEYNYGCPNPDVPNMSEPSPEAIHTPLEDNTAVPTVQQFTVTAKEEMKQSTITMTPTQMSHQVSAQKQMSGKSSGHTGTKPIQIYASNEGFSRKSKAEQLCSQKPKELVQTTTIGQREEMKEKMNKHIPADKHESKMKQMQLSATKEPEDIEHFMYVKDLNPSTEIETIVNFFEASADTGIIRDKVIFNYTKTCALLVLDSKPDLYKLKNKIDKKGIDGYKPEVYMVEQPARIAISGTKPLHSSEALGYYFETRKSDGGVIVGDVMESEDGCCFVIEFEDKQVVRRVCERSKPHIIDGNVLRVSPYYTCEAGSIWDSHLHSLHIPEQIEIPLSAGTIEFLKQDCCHELIAHFEDIHCSVSFTDNRVAISCTLTPAVADFKDRVETWCDNVQHYVDKYINNNILEETLDVKHLITSKLSDKNIEDKVWENVQQFLRTELTHEMHGAVMLPVEDLKKFTFIGFTDSVKKHIITLTKKVNEIKKQLRKTKDTMLLHHLELRLLQSMNLFDEVTNNNTDITIWTTETEVTIEGQPEDISDVKLRIHEARDCIFKSNEQLNFNIECIDFINQELIQQLNRLIQEAGLHKVEWEIVNNNLVVFSLKIITDIESDYANIGGCSADVMEIIKSNVKQESDVINEDYIEALKSDEFIAFSQDLRRKYEHQADFLVNLSDMKIIIFGMKDVVSVMKQKISDFIEENQIRKEEVLCEPILQKLIGHLHPDFFVDLEQDIENQGIRLQLEENAVKIEAKQKGIEKVKRELKKLLDTFIHVPHKIEKPAVKDVYTKEKDIGKIALIEKNTRCLIELTKKSLEVAFSDPSSESQSEMVFQQLPRQGKAQGKDYGSAHMEKPKQPDFFKAQNGLFVKLKKGVIGKQNAHVLVVATSPDLNMKSGMACASLLHEGGQSLQDECRIVKPDGIKPGEIASIHGGRLECKQVYLTTLESWKSEDKSLKVLHNLMKDCLNMASSDNLHSIAFAAMGTGQLKYPADLVARTMYQAAIEFDFENPKTMLKDVQFVCYDKDLHTIQSFEEEKMKLDGGGARLDGGEARLDGGEARLDGGEARLDGGEARLDGGGARPTYSLQSGPFVIDVVVENLAKQKVDCIVCSTAENMNLNHGACRDLLKEGGTSLQDQCETKHNNHLSVGNVVEIGPGRLHCKSLFLTVLPNYSTDAALDQLKTVITLSLDLAQAKGYSSLAMPALGAGNLRYPPDDVCQTMFDTVVRWGRDHQVSGTSVKSVRFILHAKDHVLIQKFKNHVTNAQTRAPRSTKKFKKDTNKASMRQTSANKAANSNVFSLLLPHRNNISVTPAQKKQMTSQLSSLNITIHSDSQANIDSCIKELEATLEKAYTLKKIGDYKDMIKEMNDTEVNQLCIDLFDIVDISIDKNAGVITIKGPYKEVDSANSHLVTQLLKHKRILNEKQCATELCKFVQWSFEEITIMGMELKPYDQYANFKIEKAFKNNDKQCILTSEDGTKLIIDFDNLLEYPENDRTDSVRVIRKDILKSIAMALPDNWVPMKDSENIKPVSLQPTDKDYQDIATRFLNEVKTGPYSNSPGIKFDKNKLKVTKIERIQNKTLYQLYNAKKKLMQEEKPTLPSGMVLEQQLWHGTNTTAIDSIKMHGFNRSFCGINGIWFGAGVYFAKDASYSVRGWLTGANPQPMAAVISSTTVARGCVFLAKVLTGQYCQGSQTMRYLPAVDPAKQTILYDSAVDNPAKPMEFVIFHDTQAYPEYVISFEA